MAKGFFNPKLTLHIGDGFEFMKQNQDAFDVIITDSSDPVGKCRSFLAYSCCRAVLSSVVIVAGPAESLFKESYYELMKTALRDGGILCSQGEFSGFVLQIWDGIKVRECYCAATFQFKHRLLFMFKLLKSHLCYLSFSVRMARDKGCQEINTRYLLVSISQESVCGSIWSW